MLVYCILCTCECIHVICMYLCVCVCIQVCVCSVCVCVHASVYVCGRGQGQYPQYFLVTAILSH